MTILVSKDKRSPGNEADTLTQSMSQAIKHGSRSDLRASSSEIFSGEGACIALNLGFPFQILSQSSETKSRKESLGLKLGGMPPESPNCCAVVVTCHSNLKYLPPIRGWLLSGCRSSVAEH